MENSFSGKIDITFSDYQHAVSVYNDFGCQNLGDYHNLHLKTDVLLLAGIFEKIRSVCLNVYKLDSSHFYSAPNVSWEPMLISSRVKLGLLQDIYMLLFFALGICGGINGVGELRHFRASTAPLDNFDPRQRTTLGAFYDVASLYAGTMQKLTLLDNYRGNTEVTMEQILQTSEKSNVWYFVEVNLKYPQYLHDLRKERPSTLEKFIIRSAWFSPFAKFFAIKPNKTPKLVETLLDKKIISVITKI